MMNFVNDATLPVTSTRIALDTDRLMDFEPRATLLDDARLVNPAHLTFDLLAQSE